MSVLWSPRRPRLERLGMRPSAAPRRWRVTARGVGLAGILLAVAGITCWHAWPATALAKFVAQRSHGRVLLADAEGTLWQGSAQLVLQASEQSTTSLPGRLRWQVQGAPWWLGRWRLALQHDAALPQGGQLIIGWQGVTLQAGTLRLPAAVLVGVGSPFNTLRPSGQISLTWPTLQGAWVWQNHPQNNAQNGTQKPQQGGRLGLQWAAGQAQMQVQQFASALSTVAPLGDYVADWQWQDQRATVQLRTLRGALQLQGEGQFGLGAGKNGFQGQASASPETEGQLLGLLSLLGRREGSITRLQF